jgi:hypothetical protein
MTISDLGLLRVRDRRMWKRTIRNAMAEHQGRIPEAAATLGVSIPTMHRWLAEIPNVPRAPRGARPKGAPATLPKWTACDCQAGVCVEARQDADGGQLFEVERCDTCMRFEDDENAADLVRALLEILETLGRTRNLSTVADALEALERAASR